MAALRQTQGAQVAGQSASLLAGLLPREAPETIAKGLAQEDLVGRGFFPMVEMLDERGFGGKI